MGDMFARNCSNLFKNVSKKNLKNSHAIKIFLLKMFLKNLQDKFFCGRFDRYALKSSHFSLL